MLRYIYFMLLISSINIFSDESFKVEGIWGGPKEPNFEWTLKKIIDCFLPYNPVILDLERGGSSCDEIKLLSQQFPKGQVFVFESDITKFNQLFLETKSFDNVYLYNFSSNFNCDINHVDLLRLDVRLSESLLLKEVSEYMKQSSVISIRTDALKIARFNRLKRDLALKGFELISHWYRESSQGEAVFINKKIFDAIYK